MNFKRRLAGSLALFGGLVLIACGPGSSADSSDGVAGAGPDDGSGGSDEVGSGGKKTSGGSGSGGDDSGSGGKKSTGGSGSGGDDTGSGGKSSGGSGSGGVGAGGGGTSTGGSGTGGESASGGGGSTPGMCSAGTWDDDANADTPCVAHTTCVRGEFVEAAGSPTADNTCAPCAAESFTNQINLPACIPWTVCAADPVVPGTATSDNQCDAVLQIDASTTQTCAVLAAGAVQCWGESTTFVPGFTKATGISVGAHHACVTNNDGTVQCYGDNGVGQLGIGQSGATEGTAVEVVGLDDALSVAVGEFHSCALRSDGTVTCWGDNDFGQLGDPNSTSAGQDHPVPVQGITSAVAIAAGDSHSCALLADKSVKCWGKGSSFGTSATPNGSTPVTLVSSANTRFIAAGSAHTCAVTTSDTVRCWGSNLAGQLGFVGASGSLVDLQEVAQVSAGATHTCAAHLDGSVSCWGTGLDGQLGSGAFDYATAQWTQPFPVVGMSDAEAVVAGGPQSCALRSGGRVSCWGRDSFLGDGKAGRIVRPAPVLGLSNIDSIAVGEAGNYALRSSGVVSHWVVSGSGGSVFPTDEPVYNTVLAIEAGFSACRMRSDGIFCGPTAGWGYLSTDDPPTVVYNHGYSYYYYQLEPTPLALAIGGGDGHFCTLRTDGTVACTGDNKHGQVGIGSSEASVSHMVAVPGLSQVQDIDAGGPHSCAVLSDGAVSCWGDNAKGQLGDGTSGIDRNVPVSVTGFGGATAVSAGDAHTCALLTDGTVSCWGSNEFGQLGSSTADSIQTTPVAVEGLTNVASLSAGAQHTCALLNDSTLRCWGNNQRGQLGDGTFDGTQAGVANPMPSAALVIPPVLQVSAGDDSTCALLTDGTVQCWGQGYGLLGKAFVDVVF